MDEQGLVELAERLHAFATGAAGELRDLVPTAAELESAGGRLRPLGERLRAATFEVRQQLGGLAGLAEDLRAEADL